MTMNFRARPHLLVMAVTALICGHWPQTFAADAQAQATDTKLKGAASIEKQGKVSLIEVAPAVYHTAKRYHKFYGDANTQQGGFLERSNLLGDLNGFRDDLAEFGVYFDVGVTQFLEGNLSGGDRDSPNPRQAGSSDLWLWLDSGKANLWPGGALFVHGEVNWGTSANGDVGSTLPANFDATMPNTRQRPNVALSELYMLQTLPGHLVAAAGKIDQAAWADTNMFANNERTQFTYVGLVNNPIAGAFFPYTSIGAWLDWAPNKSHNLTAVWADSDSTATQAGFDTAFNEDNSFAFQYIYSTEIAGRPGNYLLSGTYSTKDVTSFSISRVRLFEELTGDLGVADKDENYGVIGNFSQYLWVKDESAAAFGTRPHSTKARHVRPPVGIGVFGRAGWAPEDRNTIDQFYSFGIGGYGMLIPGRDDDNWGIGWAGSHISDDLRDLDREFRSWEHAFELFYNFALTPALHLSLDSQVIRPADETADTAFALGARLQIDF